MENTLNFLVISLVLSTTVSVIFVTASPVNKLSVPKNKPSDWSLSEALKPTLEKVQTHLTSWRQYFKNKLEQDIDGQMYQKVKRDTTKLEEPTNNTVNANATEQPEPYFEDYEKKFLINQTMNLLKQLLVYKEYTNSLKNNNVIVTNGPPTTPNNVQTTPSVIMSSTTDGNRVDAVLARQLRELRQLSVLQLDQVFHNVKDAAKKGAEDISISNLCCPI